MKKITDQDLINELKQKIPNHGDTVLLGYNDYENIQGEFYKSPQVRKTYIFSQKNDFHNFIIQNGDITMKGYNKKIRKAIKEEELELEKLTDPKEIEEKKKKIKGIKNKFLITLADREVFDEIVSNLGYFNIIELNDSQSSIAEELEVSKQTVNAAFKKLKNLDIIYYEIENRRMSKLCLNPRIYWKGKGEHHSDIMNSIREDFSAYDSNGRMRPGVWHKYLFEAKQREEERKLAEIGEVIPDFTF